MPRAPHNRTDGPRRAFVLVGHGGIPKDCPPALVTQLKRLEAQRKAGGGPPTAEETDIEERIRRWPRRPETDPYQAGLEALAARLAPLLDGAPLALAYNEFCAPRLEEAVAELVAAGATQITVLPSMLTPGGTHSEVEIPETLRSLQARHPAVTLRYAWPFDLDLVGRMLAEHLHRFS